MMSDGKEQNEKGQGVIFPYCNCRYTEVIRGTCNAKQSSSVLFYTAKNLCSVQYTWTEQWISIILSIYFPEELLQSLALSYL